MNIQSETTHLAAMAQVYKDEIHAGFIDHRTEESLQRAITAARAAGGQLGRMKELVRSQGLYIRNLKSTLRDRERKLRAVRVL